MQTAPAAPTKKPQPAPASTVWDGVEFDSAQHDPKAFAALRAALVAAGWTDDVVIGVHRLRVRDGGYFVSFAKKHPLTQEPGLELVPVAQAAQRLMHESIFDAELVTRLETSAEMQRDARARGQQENEARKEREKKQARLEKWFSRSKMARALAVVAAKRPKHAELLLAIANAFDVQPEGPRRGDPHGYAPERINDPLPVGDADLLLK